MEERGEEMPLLICTLADKRASFDPTLLASSKSGFGTRIFAGLGGGEVEEDGESAWFPAGTESAEEVCADWEEEEPDETCAAAPSG